MSEKQPQAPVEQQDVLFRLQQFWQKNQKSLLIGIVAVVVAVGGYWAYGEYLVKPKEEKAADAIFKAQQYFAQDSLRKALDGDGSAKGFLYVIKEFSGTKTANLAKYYAGLCHLKLGEFDKAIQQLKDFSTDSKLIQLMAYGALGDALAEADKKKEAVDAYKKAASTFPEDEYNSAEYLFRAALLSEVLGDNKQALALHKEVKEKYPKTDKGIQADKYIYRLSVEPNEFSVK